jgi:hypothetical protein
MQVDLMSTEWDVPEHAYGLAQSVESNRSVTNRRAAMITPGVTSEDGIRLDDPLSAIPKPFTWALFSSVDILGAAFRV